MASNYALLRRHFQERVLGNLGLGLSVVERLNLSKTLILLVPGGGIEPP
jgi:hypothetical protein